MLALLESLCNIDSRSRENPSGTVQAAKTVAQELEPLGFNCELVAPEEKEVADIRHLVAVNNPDGKKKIVLLAHLDTVLSPEEVPYSVDTDKGRIYGSGISDMKGGVVIMIEALKMLYQEDTALLEMNITVILNSSEEVPLPSFAKLAREHCQNAAAVLNFEPGFLGDEGEHIIVRGRKGIFRYRLTCEGRAAHAGNHHHCGANAIREIARKVEEIEALTDYERGITANVGRIEGGKVYNQVADWAQIEFEVRSVQKSLLNEMDEALRTICDKITIQSSDQKFACKTKLEKLSGFPTYPENPGTSRLVELYQNIAEKHNIKADAIVRGGASDSNCVSDLAPTIDGLGILGGDFHNKDEWGDLNSISRIVQITNDFIKELCQTDRLTG